jgi:AcrR family transcriptional regulator
LPHAAANKQIKAPAILPSTGAPNSAERHLTLSIHLDTVKCLGDVISVKPTEDLRRRLLDASIDLLATEGLNTFSMREVARRAGVSHQAPYHYFTDREAILAEIVVEGFQQLRADMVTAAATAKSPGKRLSAIGRAYVAFALANPAHFKLMFRSEMVPSEKHEVAHACANSAFDLLVSTVDEVVRENMGKPDPALVLAAWSLAHGLATLMLEGKLKEQIGDSRRSQIAAAHDALDAFTRLIER